MNGYDLGSKTETRSEHLFLKDDAVFADEDVVRLKTKTRLEEIGESFMMMLIMSIIVYSPRCTTCSPRCEDSRTGNTAKIDGDQVNWCVQTKPLITMVMDQLICCWVSRPKCLLMSEIKIWRSGSSRQGKKDGITSGGEGCTYYVACYQIKFEQFNALISAIAKRFECVVLDENHKMKNSKARSFRAIQLLDARRFIFLTSIPMLNRALDLHGFLSLLWRPGFEKVNPSTGVYLLHPQKACWILPRFIFFYMALKKQSRKKFKAFEPQLAALARARAGKSSLSVFHVIGVTIPVKPLNAESISEESCWLVLYINALRAPECRGILNSPSPATAGILLILCYGRGWAGELPRLLFHLNNQELWNWLSARGIAITFSPSVFNEVRVCWLEHSRKLILQKRKRGDLFALTFHLLGGNFRSLYFLRPLFNELWKTYWACSDSNSNLSMGDATPAQRPAQSSIEYDITEPFISFQEAFRTHF